jgi:hypothetical protein
MITAILLAPNHSSGLDGNEVFDKDKVYVILYYYYDEARYSISDDINGDWKVNCNPVFYATGLKMVMLCVTYEDETEDFDRVPRIRITGVTSYPAYPV